MDTVELLSTLPPGCVWSDFEHASMVFCEKLLCGLVTQPANTWSNLGYVFVGILIILRNKNHNLNLIGPIAILVGLSSFFYHMSFTFVGQFFDLSSMFMFAILLIKMNLRRMGWLKRKDQTPFFIIMMLISMVPLWVIRGKIGIYIFGVELTIALCLEMIIKRKNPTINYSYFYKTLACFGMAYLFWTLDFKRLWCDPENHWLQGHALWHIINAFCFYYIAKFYDQLDWKKLT